MVVRSGTSTSGLVCLEDLPKWQYANQHQDHVVQSLLVAAVQELGGGDAGKLIAEASKNGLPVHDFLGFQECKNVAWVMDLAKDHGLPGEYKTLSLVLDDRALGIAYLSSTWTLLENGWEDVGEDHEDAYYGRRAALWGRFQHSNGLVLFFINHHGPLPISKSGDCVGSAVAYNIMRVISEKAHVRDAVVLVGDFNAKADSSRITTLDTYMNRIFTGTSHGGVDHVFSNCGESAVVEKDNLGSGGSDHDSLSVSFSFPTWVLVEPTS